MKKLFIVFFVILSTSDFFFSQSWNLLPNSPIASWRHDDISFINADTGWVVNVDGYIYKTTDGGNNWNNQLYQPNTSFRCVGFANKNKGWAGNLGIGNWSPTIDTLPLYQTNDGGANWFPATNISGPLPKGLCGMSVVSDSVVYAVGRVGGPAFIIKTINGGQSWISVVAPSPISSLVDCKFFSKDTGFIAGGVGAAGSERASIYYTTNGGQNWQAVYTATTNLRASCWKLNFPSRTFGYSSVEVWPNQDSMPVLKTVDGGLSWTEKLISIPNFWSQGIGFVNDSVGWCGANPGQIKKTSDGGNSWTLSPFVANFNRLRRINDTVSYASGQRIWKYSKNSTLSVSEISSASNGLKLEQNYPNPFIERTTIKYHTPKTGQVMLKLYDWTGRPIRTIVNETQNEGWHEVEISLQYISDASFYYSLNFEGSFLTKKAIMIKK